MPSQETPTRVDSIDNVCDSTTRRPNPPSSRKIRKTRNYFQPPDSRARRQTFQYRTDFHISGLAWLNRREEPFELALCSLETLNPNCLRIVRLAYDDPDEEIAEVATIAHHYPATKVLWMPQPENYALGPFDCQYSGPADSLLATSSDHLRLWRVERRHRSRLDLHPWMYTNEHELERALEPRLKTEVRLECVLDQHSESDRVSPLTSFDWNEVDPRLIATTSLDGHGSLWDIEYGKLIISFDNPFCMSSYEPATRRLHHRLVTHGEPAYDISFSRYGSGRDLMVSVGGDRKINCFDTREMRKVVLYDSSRTEASQKHIVRVNCTKFCDYFISFLEIESNSISVMDRRRPNQLLCSLSAHRDQVNCVSWAPHSTTYLASASNDKQAMIWNIDIDMGSYDRPVLAYDAEKEINALSWSASHPDWIAIAHDKQLELLRV